MTTPNSQFLQLLFPTPLFVGTSGDEKARASIEALSYAYLKESYEQERAEGLVSEGWTDHIKTADVEKKKKMGITSFYNDNLVHNEDWKDAYDFILNMAGTMLSEYHNVEGMKIANMWTTIYPDDAFVPEHIHACFSVSGVYYVKAPKDCGNIVFRDPSWVAKTMNVWAGNKTFPHDGTTHSYTPEPGLMILFPSWLPHSTRPNLSGEDRIIVSFNLDFGEVNFNAKLHDGVDLTKMDPNVANTESSKLRDGE